MTDLRNHLLVWHKQAALVTGGLSLTYARSGLPRADVENWIERLRNVADDMESVIGGGPFLLDSKGARVVQSGAANAATGLEKCHEVVKPAKPDSGSKTLGVKPKGLRVATRKKTP